jgi:hypothetical protein
MDNLVNSLVSKTIGLTDQQVVNKLLANPNMNDSQIVQFMQTNGVSPSQMSKVANIPEGQIAARVAATLSPNQATLLGDTWVQSNYQTTGSGENEQIGPLESIAVYKTPGGVNDKIPVGTNVQSYSPNGELVNTTQTKKDLSFFGGIKEALKDPYVQAAILGAVGGASGLFSGAPAGTTLGTLGAETLGSGALTAGGTGLTAGSSLSGLTAGSSLGGVTGTLGATNAALGGAALGSTLAGASTLPLGTTLGALGAAGAGSSLLNAGAGAAAGSALGAGAGSALGTTLGTGLAASALGNLAGTAANQSGINNARDLINTYGGMANTQLNTAYNDARNLGVAGRTDLGNIYTNTNTNLNNTINAQAGAYDLANQGIKANAATQLGLLGSTYQGQKDQAAANAAALNTNYGNARGDLYDIYNKQVGFQQPYQDVGRAGSQGLIDNQGYLTRQFGASDLNEQLAPNYAFQLAQGQMANQRVANMGGGSIGGNALQGLQKYTQDYASGAYQNAFTNFQNQRQNIYSTLAGMANIGTTSGGQLASLGNTLGGNLGSLSNTLGSNLTSNTGNLLNAGNVYGSNTSGVVNNLNNVLSSNLGQMQGAYNQYGSNLTNAANTYGGNLTTNYGQGINAANVYGLNSANLATGLGSALATNATATGANNATALSNLGSTALLGSMIKAT